MEGVRFMFAGEYDQAQTIFETLYEKTGAVRVKLEWARAAFLGRRYNLSRHLFEEILAENIPDAVRFSIGIYINEIARQGGDMLDYGFSMISDTNPFLAAKRQVIHVYGIPFEYEPPHQPKPLFGMQGYLSYYHALNEAETLRVLFDGDHTQYDGHDNSKTNLRLALQGKLRTGDKLSLRLGLDHYFEHGRLLIRQPYVGLRWRQDQLTGALNQIQIDARVGENQFPDYDYMNGSSRSLSGVFTKNLTDTFQVGVTLHTDDTRSNLRSQSYRTLSAAGWVQVFVPQLSSSAQLGYSITRRKFQAKDEMFLVDRVDERKDISLTIRPYALKFWSLYPALVVGHSEANSNISLYQYTNSYINVSLRKNF